MPRKLLLLAPTNLLPYFSLTMEEASANGSVFIEKIDGCSNASRQLVRSEVPEICQKEPCILGVDEAGRGPVLGPMVYGISYCPLSKKEDFANLGCADSKTLTEQKRESIFEILCANKDFVGWAVDVISPNYISNSMLRRSKHSLNEVALDSTVSLIKQVLMEGAIITEIYVDTVGPPEKYQERLSKIFPECKVTVAKKADALFPIVSGASICAKVCRDRIISNWSFSEAIEVKREKFGSGYPNDPDTKSFLSSTMDDIFGFPNLVRFSWSTASKILEKSAVAVEWEEEENENINQSDISTFFKKPTVQKHSLRHRFFTENQLNPVDTF